MSSTKQRIWFAGVLLVLLIIIVVQNTLQPPVEFRIFFWKISMSQVILLPLAVLVGFLFGYLLARLGRGKKS
jgi:uncharacterized integral membrane protein